MPTISDEKAVQTAALTPEPQPSSASAPEPESRGDRGAERKFAALQESAAVQEDGTVDAAPDKGLSEEPTSASDEPEEPALLSGGSSFDAVEPESHFPESFEAQGTLSEADIPLDREEGIGSGDTATVTVTVSGVNDDPDRGGRYRLDQYGRRDGDRHSHRVLAGR